MRLATVLALGFLASAAWGMPRTPGILVDGRASFAQVPEKGRVRVTYDVRPVAGQGARVEAFRMLPGNRVEPAGSWSFAEVEGTVRLDFAKMPVGVYAVVATATDGGGAALGEPSLPVYLEYGGRKAWRGLREGDLRAEAPPFSGVGASFRAQADEPRITLAPATAVVAPGDEVEFRAEVANLAEDEEITWTLDGEGSLETIDGRTARYVAPDVSGNRVVTIRAVGGPDELLEGRATVIVTTTQVE